MVNGYDIFIAAAGNLGKGRIFLIEKETSVEKVKGVAAALQDSVYLRFKEDTPKDTMIAAAQALKNRVKFYFDINNNISTF